MSLKYISPNAFSVPGNRSALFTTGRALMAVLGGVKTYGIYVLFSEYDNTFDKTIVTTTGIPLTSNLQSIWLGQSPDNAPQQLVSSPLMALIFG